MARPLVIFSIVVLLAGFSSCARKEVRHSNAYFDLRGFFASEIASLNHQNKGYIKTLQIDGEKSSFRNDKVDWQKELQIFSAIQLNKPSYNGKFRVDSVMSDDSLTINYRATDEKIPVRSFSITLVNQKTQVVKMLIAENSLVYRSKTSLQYISGKGYFVDGNQSLKGLTPTEFQVSALFEP